MSSSDRLIPFEALRDLAERMFRAVGTPPDEAALVADTLACADARGMHSHGVLRLPVYIEKIQGGGFKPGRKGKVLRETDSIAFIDAEDGLGQVAIDRAIDLASLKAQRTGVGAVAVTNSNHYGEGAYYVRKPVDKGLFVLLTSNGAPNTPVWGGTGPRMTGPLPLTVGVPVKGRAPFLLDIAMGMLARGKILYAAEKGLPVPLGTGLDAEGQPTTDPRKILDGGRILPIGGYKGFGLTMVLEILCGVLTGGAVGTGLRELYNAPELAQKIGHFALVIDPAAFTGRDLFLANMAAYLDMIKSSDRMPGVDEIIIAGEPEEQRFRERLATGIPLEPKVIVAMEELAGKLGIADRLPEAAR